MDALGIFRFWRNTAVRADVSTDEEGEKQEVIDCENSLFDLAFKSLEVDPKESPRDVVFPGETGFRSHRSPRVAAHRSAPNKFKVFALGFRKSPRHAKIVVSGKPVLGRENGTRVTGPRENRDSSEKSVPKYLKLIKPFYVRASGKGKPTGSATPSLSPVTAPANPSPMKFGEVSRAGSFKVATRSLRKSRSALTVDGAAPPSYRRRDESLLEQQHEGIQSAILHCKRSYTNSSSSTSSSRDSSDTWHEKLTRNSCDELKRCSI